MIKKRVGIIAAVLSICLLTVGCVTGGGESNSKTNDTVNSNVNKDNKVFKIGVSDSLTGTAAPYGLPGSKAIQLAAEQVNNEGGIDIGGEKHNIELVIYDNKSDAGESVSIIQKLVDIDNIQFILGWGSSTPTLAAVKSIEDKEITIISGNARSPEILLYEKANVFRSATVNCYDPIEDCEYIKSKGISKIALFAFFNDSGYSVHANTVKDTFEKIGVEVVATENMNAGENDFLSQMTKIANSGAEAVYMAGNIEESAMALRQLRELGSEIPMYTYSSGTGEQWLEICTNEQMKNTYAIRPAVADLGSSFDSEARAFIDAYQAKFNEHPSQTATNTYDNFWILMAALQRAGTTEWAAVNAALGELTVEELDSRVIIPYDSVDGKLFDSIGQAYHPYSVLRWGEEEKNWIFEGLIGENLGAEFFHNYMRGLAKEKDVELSALHKTS